MDSLISANGTWSSSGVTLSSVMTDNSADTWAFSSAPGSYLQLGFTDTLLVNGAGADLAIFEIGVSDSFNMSLSVGGTMMDYVDVDTGFNAGSFDINLALIDFDDFAVGAGATLSEITVYGIDAPGGTACCSPTFGLVGILNSASTNNVPEPSLLVLLSLGLAGIGFIQRRKSHNA